MFYSYFVVIFEQKFQNVSFGWPVGYLSSIQSITGISSKFPDILITIFFFFLHDCETDIEQKSLGKQLKS